MGQTTTNIRAEDKQKASKNTYSLQATIQTNAKL